MKRDPVILIVVAIVISLMLVFGIQKARHNNSSASIGGTSKLQGQLAPDFALASLDGKTLKLSDYRGKAVLLNFWATWCEPCKIEMPWFVDLQKKYGPQGLQVVGIAMDDASPKEIGEFAQKMNVNYPVLVGKEAVGDWLTASIALGSLLAILFWKKLPEPVVILAGGAIGLLTYQVIRPEWLLR